VLSLNEIACSQYSPLCALVPYRMRVRHVGVEPSLLEFGGPLCAPWMAVGYWNPSILRFCGNRRRLPPLLNSSKLKFRLSIHASSMKRYSCMQIQSHDLGLQTRVLARRKLCEVRNCHGTRLPVTVFILQVFRECRQIFDKSFFNRTGYFCLDV